MSHRKRMYGWWFLPILVLIIVLAGCGGGTATKADQKNSGSAESEKKTEQDNKQTVELSIATGGTTGTYFPIGSGIAKAAGESGNFKIAVQTSGGSIANLKMVKNGEVQLILSASNTTFAAYNGEDPFQEQIRNVRAIAALYPETFQFVVRKDSGMQTIEDLKGKKIAVGAPGSGTERTGKLILEAHGITYDDIKPEFLNFGEAVTALKDKNIDAAIIGSGIPTAAVVDAAASMDIALLEVNKEKFEKFTESQPFFTMVTIPAGVYKGVDKEVVSGASPALLLVDENRSEEEIYLLTKEIFEHIGVLQAAHVQGKNISLDNALKGVSIPLHPGAAKYYKEKGLDVSNQ